MTKKPTRVRFAPSPTGPLHVGGVRTALFNYLFAKKNDGAFVLRIEDTDKKREVEGAEKYILDSLKWCGISVDEGPKIGGEYGPYRQSERNRLYNKEIESLLDSGHAYYAFDSEEELSNQRKECEKKGETFMYNWRNRLELKNSLSMQKKEVEMLISRGEKHVVRFLSPKDKTIETFDIVRGHSRIDSNLIDDKILIKADGTPTYHFANIVDDHHMKITHVIRGEEWLPSLALHQLLYESFGWEKPLFAHLPLILNPSGKGKLSKRSGEKSGFPVFPIKWRGDVSFEGFREFGILPSGLVNYLATLGWTPDEEAEILEITELIKLFELEKVVSAGANFDLEKLKWNNHKHIQNTKDKILVEELCVCFNEAKSLNEKLLIKAVGLVKERANTVKDLWGLLNYLFYDPIKFDEKSVTRIKKEGLEKILSAILLQCKSASGEEVFINDLKAWGEENNIGAGQIMMSLRVVLVGSLNGVDLQKIVSFVGLKNVARRASRFLGTNI